jgi:hypothetical protein
MNGNAATRARKLAKPSWGDNGRSNTEFNDLLNEESYLNATVGWSFNWSWVGTGDWSDVDKYKVDPPAKSTTTITNYQPLTFHKTVEL